MSVGHRRPRPCPRAPVSGGRGSPGVGLGIIAVLQSEGWKVSNQPAVMRKEGGNG